MFWFKFQLLVSSTRELTQSVTLSRTQQIVDYVTVVDESRMNFVLPVDNEWLRMVGKQRDRKVDSHVNVMHDNDPQGDFIE